MDDPASLDKVAALLTGPDGQCLIYCPQCDFSVAKVSITWSISSNVLNKPADDRFAPFHSTEQTISEGSI